MFRELQGRELRDVETCRRVWEEEGDPLAVVAAVATSDALPPWLQAAVLVLLTEGQAGYPVLSKKAWRARSRDSIAAIRAAELAGARAHPEQPQTWEVAAWMAVHFARERFPDIPTVTAEGARRSYKSVRRGLAQHPSRFYRAPGIGAEISKAWARQRDLMTAALGAAKK